MSGIPRTNWGVRPLAHVCLPSEAARAMPRFNRHTRKAQEQRAINTARLIILRVFPKAKAKPLCTANGWSYPAYAKLIGGDNENGAAKLAFRIIDDVERILSA